MFSFFYFFILLSTNLIFFVFFFFFFKQKTAYEMLRSLVGSEMCIRDRSTGEINERQMPLHTRFTELVGIEHPVLCGGMQYVGYAGLSAAVSNAGGLGTVSALTARDPDLLRAEIRACAALTSKPFAVNFTILPMMGDMLKDYHLLVQVVIDEGVKVVQTAGNSPDRMKLHDGRTLLKWFKDAGIVVIHKCMSVKHALAAERGGVDCISLGAYEYGGHIGNGDTTHWVQQAKAGLALKVPFIVAGATAHGSQLAAALAMGASGVEIGTGFMATQECNIQQGIKDCITSPTTDDTSTILLLRKVHNVGRFYKNDLTKKVAALEEAHPGEFGPLAPYMTGKRTFKSLQESGDPDDSAWTCGVATSFITSVPTCKEFLETLVGTAEDSIRASANLIASRL
eukprot:TRINITY_DN23790_c0_g1_i2.p1 TRINITY_DN23790_c0_g1~~TRINITY_DN23790_c0_g1_i2.p1  ORF type:complete len:397 (-),score=117.52 TRINITY_DN23790_c0_g1_i2:327-1517(-)